MSYLTELPDAKKLIEKRIIDLNFIMNVGEKLIEVFMREA